MTSYLIRDNDSDYLQINFTDKILSEIGMDDPDADWKVFMLYVNADSENFISQVTEGFIIF